MENITVLQRKLELFRKKYYKNMIIRGIIYSNLIMSLQYLLFIALEYHFHFNQGLRIILLIVFVFISISAIGYYVISPTLKLLNIGKVITNETAGRLIGKYFNEISDKLINTLQLIDLKEKHSDQPGLVMAAVDQKIEKLKLCQFQRVIRIAEGLKYLKYGIIPFIVILIGIAIAPAYVADPAVRIIHYKNDFPRSYPYTVILVSYPLEAIQREDFEVQIKVTGEEIPSEFYYVENSIEYRMEKSTNRKFSHRLKGLQNSIIFQIKGGEYQSPVYTLNVYPKPIILNFEAEVTYPGYIQRNKEKFENIGDLVIPQGATIDWTFYTIDVDTVRMKIEDSVIYLTKLRSNGYTCSYKPTRNSMYSVLTQNEYVKTGDSLTYKVSLIQDKDPWIYVKSEPDGTEDGNLYFSISIKDDYGFSSLSFVYRSIHEESQDRGDLIKKELKFERGESEQVIYFTTKIDSITKNPGEQIVYYFEVCDNDDYNGYKCVKTTEEVLKRKAQKEVENEINTTKENLKNEFDQTIQDTKEIRKELLEINRKLVEKGEAGWQEKKNLESILKMNTELVNRIENIKETNRKTNEIEKSLNETSERILEKQKLLNELMDKLLTEEMKRLMQEIRELMDQIDKGKLSEALEKIELTRKEIESQLDRNLELFKQIEYDRKLEQAIRDLRTNAEEQEKLNEENEKGKMENKETLEKQKMIEANQDTIHRKLKELEEMESSVEIPAGITKTKKIQESIKESLSEARSKLQRGESKEAGEKQKESSKKMNELADMLENMQLEAEISQGGEDASMVRKMLENLLRMSFLQEELIMKTREIRRNDPSYLKLVEDQDEITKKLKGTEDSLREIGKRQIFIQPVILRELVSVTANIKQSVDALNERNIPISLAKQQYSLTALNNLANLLDESLKEMNKNMSSCMQAKGSKSCKNPSNKPGGNSVKGMRELQQKLTKQLQDLKKGMEGREGETREKMNNGKPTLSEQAARLAAEQEAIREALQKYGQQLQSKGEKDIGNLQEAIQKMEQNETDILNKRISRETLERQREIETRLLESEMAEQMREKQEKRESTEAKSDKISNPNPDFEYKMQKKGETVQLRYYPIQVTRFYHERINRYMLKMNECDE